MAVLVPNAGDTTSGNKYEALDQAEPDSLDFEILSVSSGVLTGGEVTSNTSATTVAVSAGTVVLSGAPYAFSAAATLALPSAPADNRFDLVVARVTAGVAALAVVQGANSSTNPSFPKSTSVITGSPSLSTNVNFSTDVVLAAIYRSGAAVVTTSRILDKRKLIGLTSINDQGATAPASSYGSTGNLYQQTGTPNGVSSGVFVKGSDGTWIELAQNVGAHLPIGAIVAWPTDATIPTGCVEANGQALSTASYPGLFSVYGYVHGGSGGSFNVPNFSNRYLRGTTSAGLVGTTLGSDTITIPADGVPAHTHSSAHTHTLAHTHGVDHDHASFATASGGTHSHSMGPLPLLVQSLSSVTYIDIKTTADGNDLFWGTTNVTYTDGAHSHTVDVPAYTGSTTSQSTSTTSAASSEVTGSYGAGTPWTSYPNSIYTRWIVRASLGSDPSYTGGSPTATINQFSQSAEITPPAATTSYYLWVAAFACDILRVRAYRTGGTGATVNVKVNGAYALSVDLSLPLATTWTSVLADLNVAVVEGDVVELYVASVTGSPTEVIMQVDYSV